MNISGNISGNSPGSDELVHRLDLNIQRRLHVVGVGGPGMSSVALALAGMGHETSGSDIRESLVLDHLRAAGVAISVGHDASLVEQCDGVTSSPAIPADNIEVKAARDRHIFFSRAEMLASICAVRPTIGVAGTHGKTTTSALMVRVLEKCGLRPSFVVGGELIDEGTSARWNDGPWTVVEADESDGTHLHLPLAATILTNVDIDHLDHFADFDAIVESFTQYLVKVPGPSVVCLDDAGCRQVLSDPRFVDRSNLITYGADSSAQVRYSDITVEKGTTQFTVTLRPASQTERLVRVKTTLRGVHNVANITAVIAMADALGIPVIEAAGAVSEFTGVGRRFQIAGQINDLTFVDDYAHLPREIDAVLQAARTSDEGWNRIVAVFQPNRFNRMAKISASYADCFQNADVVVVTDIYGSGTTPIAGVTGHLVVQAIESVHPEIDLHWAPERDSLAEVVSRILKPGDLCISMGCGDIETLPFELLDIFREAQGID